MYLVPTLTQVIHHQGRFLHFHTDGLVPNKSDLVQAHLNEYECLSSQFSAQGMTIEDELRAMLLISSLPPSRQTFVTTVCNTSTTVVKYSEVTSAILTEAAQRKSFAKDWAEEAYVVQGSAGRPNNEGRSCS